MFEYYQKVTKRLPRKIYVRNMFYPIVYILHGKIIFLYKHFEYNENNW